MKKDTKKLVTASLFTALACVFTLLSFPLPYGYANLGDCMVLLGSFVLSPLYGCLAGGIGTALADLFLGYGIYAPATLVIKALVAFTAGTVYRKIKKKNMMTSVFSGIAGEIVMVLGYFLYEYFLLGYGFGATASVFGNVMQGVVGIVAAAIILPFIKKVIK